MPWHILIHRLMSTLISMEGKLHQSLVEWTRNWRLKPNKNEVKKLVNHLKVQVEERETQDQVLGLRHQEAAEDRLKEQEMSKIEMLILIAMV